jgi:hypothetical protein
MGNTALGQVILILASDKESDDARWRFIHQRWQEHGLPERCECPECARENSGRGVDAAAKSGVAPSLGDSGQLPGGMTFGLFRLGRAMGEL